MASLRELLASLGFTDVLTLLNSGNALFSTNSVTGSDLEVTIEAAIERELGIAVQVLVRSGEEIGAVIRDNPILSLAVDGSKMIALFLSGEPAPTLLATYDPAGLDPGRIAVGNRVIYQWCPDGFLEAPAVGAFVEKNLRVTVTARNWNTVARLGALLGR